MSWRDAPLYVHAHDLARDLLPRTEAWSQRGGAALGGLVGTSALELLTLVALALTFPEERANRLRLADDEVARLRVMLRLASDLGLLSAGAARLLHARLDDIGRMIGGWRKRVEHSARDPPG